MMIFTKMVGFAKKNVVLMVAVLAAVITSFIIPPDKQYISYFDFKTLSCLFCVLAVVCALKNINFFYILAQKIVKSCRNIRASILTLVYITFIGSMLIANDMAFTFIMQNIAANLGGMLTPFGNPQNLYLYTKYNINDYEFVGIMFVPFAVSVILITICCLFVKKEPLEISEKIESLNKKRTILYAILFVLAIAIVFRGIPYYVGLIIIPIVLLFADQKALKMVDYPLLLTFVAFFIFAGNMARIDAVRNLFSWLLEQNTLLFSAISCQVISNVPSAILLSQFTDNYRELLVGVNIGGTGTLIASLASLITFREYTRHNPTKVKSYIGMFSAFNFGFLIILLIVSSLLFH